MANVVRDPKEHPEAVLADFSHADPLVTFQLKDVAFVYGSRWKQRFFTKIGDDYYAEPAQWDVAKKRWLPYHAEAGTDWWVPLYGPTNFDRPTGPLCDGCHSVNYNVATKQVTEWNVGCEKCHGPGSDHVAKATRDNIVNPAKLDSVRGNDTCIQCHSQGRPVNETGLATQQGPAGGLYRGGPALGLLAARRVEAGHCELLPVSRHDRAQESHAGQRLHSKHHVPPRAAVFRLPQRAQQCEWKQPEGRGQRAVPAMSCGVDAECGWAERHGCGAHAPRGG
jgi:hypothetical protein